jgi:hypothetical protein
MNDQRKIELCKDLAERSYKRIADEINQPWETSDGYIVMLMNMAVVMGERYAMIDYCRKQSVVPGEDAEQWEARAMGYAHEYQGLFDGFMISLPFSAVINLRDSAVTYFKANEEITAITCAAKYESAPEGE